MFLLLLTALVAVWIWSVFWLAGRRASSRLPTGGVHEGALSDSVVHIYIKAGALLLLAVLLLTSDLNSR